MKKLITAAIAASVVLIACSKTNEQAESANSSTTTGGTTGGTTGSNGCDTANMKYSTNIKPILQASCYSCHGNGQTESGVGLDTYDQVLKQVNNNHLIGVITHAAGYPAMPYNQPKLSDCDINKIKSWIIRGSANN